MKDTDMDDESWYRLSGRVEIPRDVIGRYQIPYSPNKLIVTQ